MHYELIISLPYTKVVPFKIYNLPQPTIFHNNTSKQMEQKSLIQKIV